MSIPSIARMLRDIKTPEGFEREVKTEPKTKWRSAFKILILKSADIRIEIWFDGSRESYSLASGHVTFDTSAGQRTFDRYGVEDSFYIDNPAKVPLDRLLVETRVVHKHTKTLGTVTESPGYKEFGENRKNSWSDDTTILWDTGDVKTYSKRLLKQAQIFPADSIEQVNATIKRIIEVRIPEVRERLGRSENVPGIPWWITPELKKTIVQRLRNGDRYDFMPSGFGTGYTLRCKKDEFSKRAEERTEMFFGISPLYVSTFDAD